MKHLKPFFESKLDPKFKPHINWDLVNDVKDMSLEYLDSGNATLIIDFYYENKWFYGLKFNHSGERGDYVTYNVLIPHNLKDNKISYKIYLVTTSNLQNSMEEQLVRMCDTKELISRIREAYPEEIIKTCIMNESFVNESKVVHGVVEDRITKECNDILLEITDLGFQTKCDFLKIGHSEQLKIEIMSKNKFEFKDIEDVVYRLQDYLEDEGLISGRLNKDIKTVPFCSSETFELTGKFMYVYKLEFDYIKRGMKHLLYPEEQEEEN